MPRNPDDGGDDEVGYGRPPKRHQFKPGASGNPKGGNGRKKATRSASVAETVADDVADELNETLIVRENGHEKRISKRRAFVKALINSAIKGDVRAINAVVALAKNFGAAPLDGAPNEDDEESQDELDDLEILESFVERERQRRARRDDAQQPSSKNPTGEDNEQ